MPNLECPSCGTVSFQASFERDADAFCRVCDFPLFWAEEGAEIAVGQRLAQQRQRLPGVAGHRVLGGISCPVCRETNPYDGVNCYRCGADLHPEPEPEAEVGPPEPLLEPLEPLLLKPAGRTISLSLLATALGLVLLVVALGAGIWQAIDATGTAFGSNQNTIDAATAGAPVLEARGLHYALPVWAGIVGFFGLGILLAGLALMTISLVPHAQVEARTTDLALPRLQQQIEGMRQ